MSAPNATAQTEALEVNVTQKQEPTAASMPPPEKTYTVSCHCKSNVFTVSLPETFKVVECNCSICRKEGILSVKAGFNTKQISWIRGSEGSLTGYEYFTKEEGCWRFLFCPICRTMLLGRKESEGNSDVPAGVNARALRGVDVYSLEIEKVDFSGTPPLYVPKKAEDVDFETVEEGLRVYDGSCHCGALTWKVKSKPLEDVVVTECNCSFCKRNGDLYIYPSPGFAVVSPKSAPYITSYVFGERRLSHEFCKVCGVSTMEIMNEKPGVAHGVNVRCLDGVDVWGLKRRMSDGWSIYQPQYVEE